jgi:TRAP-type C4-dicarboxylate transport system permease small subunit
MAKIWRVIELVLATCSLIALASLVVLPVLQVVLRDVFMSPLTGLEEATRWGLIILVFLGAPLLVLTNEQIRLGEFIDRLPKQPRRVLERVILLVSGLSLGVIVWAGVVSILRNFGTRTPTLDVPFWLFASPMLVGLGAAALGCVWLALRREHPPTDNSTTVI